MEASIARPFWLDSLGSREAWKVESLSAAGEGRWEGLLRGGGRLYSK